MAKTGDVSEKIRRNVVDLLNNFESELHKKDVREKVLSLIPIIKRLRVMGKTLLSPDLKLAARDRILQYFMRYPFTIIKGDELFIISGIQEWPRRLRELRVQLGWAILDGHAAKEMFLEREIEIPNVDFSSIKTSEYILINEKQDKESAHRWFVANEIRKKKLSMREKILEYLRKNVGAELTGNELRYVAGDKTEWARRVRELRTDLGWPVETKMSGRPDLKSGYYVLAADRQSPEHDRTIPDKLRREVLRRDGYKCIKCGWSQIEWNRSDPRHLELHHLKPVKAGGKSTEENLITICVVCHDAEHRR